jgi:glycosyltransferase involved in cell wall biosynthesis
MEPFGLVMIEAMGTPVIAWRNGSVLEIIEDGRSGLTWIRSDMAVEAIGWPADRSISCSALLRMPFHGRLNSRKLARGL